MTCPLAFLISYFFCSACALATWLSTFSFTAFKRLFTLLTHLRGSNLGILKYQLFREDHFGSVQQSVGCLPNMNKEGEHFVEACTDVHIPNRAASECLSQSSWFSFTNLVKMPFSTWLVLSSRPLVWGWQVSVTRCFTWTMEKSVIWCITEFLSLIS